MDEWDGCITGQEDIPLSFSTPVSIGDGSILFEVEGGRRRLNPYPHRLLQVI
jgi:hypothetical protein